MRKALKGVKSMEYWGYIRFNGNSWNQLVHVINQNGLIRQEVAKSRTQKVTFVTNDDHRLMSYERLPFATLSKIGDEPEEAAEPDEPLKIAVMSLAGSSDDDYSVKSSESAPVNGRATYTLSYELKQRRDTPESRSFQILVDEATNLPIESTYRSDSKDVGADLKYKYVYNRQYDESIFSLDPHKPLINPAIEQKKLAEQWSRVQEPVGHAPIYSSSVSPEGTIWIAFGVEDQDHMGSVPNEVVSSNGLKYVRGIDRITSWQPGNRTFLVNQKTVVITPFIPLSDRDVLPTQVQIRYENRDAGHGEEAKFVTVPLSKENWNIPSYFPAVSYGRDMLSFPMEFWQKRANALRDQGNLLAAAQAYETQAEKCKGFVEYIGYKSLLEAAKCYETLGNNAEKVKTLRERAAELQKSRIR